MADNEPPMFADFLKNSPKNWGKWGPTDEIGCLNYLGEAEALAGAAEIRSGKSFTLGLVIGNPQGEPMWPGRRPARRVNSIDHGHWAAGKGIPIPGGVGYSDDMIVMDIQSSSQYDALAHAWHDGQVWNGYSADTTVGGHSIASIVPIAEHGVVGRGILLDMAKFRGKRVLDPGETFTHEDLMACAASQNAEIHKRDILLVHTGWVSSFYEGEAAKFSGGDFIEPGLTYSPELVQWFHDMEIPNWVTDTIANEVTLDPGTGLSLPLHQALMRNLGVVFTEILNLTPLANDCATDGQYTFLYTAAPLKIHEATGAPVNPIVVK
jgi:kynurenine formamidase